MVPEHDVDPADLYERERLAFVALLRGASPEQLATMVPATPAWSVHDVLAHLVGITADLNAQQFGDGDADAWTARQITARRGASIEDLAAEWAREAPTFEGGLRLFGYWFGAHYLGDLLIHAGDVRAALGEDPTRDDENIVIGLDFYLKTFEESITAAAIGALAVRAGDEQWTLGDGEVVASLTAPRYELFRALAGRRTETEIRSMDWTGDVDAVIGIVSCYPMPRVSLDEV